MQVWKPTKEQIASAYDKHIADVIVSGLEILFSGINPSLYSAAVGHHFARPGNRFWPALHEAGLTQTLVSPFDDQALIEEGLGITNVVARATARADELTSEDYLAGARRLKSKIRRYQPRKVAVLGVTAYRAAFREPNAQIGLQPKDLQGVQLWVLPNPSGLNAHYQLADLAKLYGQLGNHR